MPTDTTETLPARGIRHGEVPYRMSYNTGHDGEPVFWGDYIVYSRVDLTNNRDADWCIAYLHVDSTSISDLSSCPDGGGGNDLLDAWIDPVFSPDGSRVAFFRTLGSARRQGFALDFDLMVGPADDPGSAARLLNFDGGIFETGDVRPARATRGRDLNWWNDSLLIVIGGLDDFSMADTSFIPLGVASINVATGDVSVQPVPPALGLTVGEAGEAYIVPRESCPDMCGERPVIRLLRDGSVDTVTVIPDALDVIDMDVVDGRLIILSIQSVLDLDLVTGALRSLTLSLPFDVVPQALALHPAGFIAAQLDPVVGPSNIWLLEVP